MDTSDKLPTLSMVTIVLIAVVQLALAIVFIIFPDRFAAMLGLEEAPPWTSWIFAQYGARALGFSYGMWLVLRDARRHVAWIKAMIAVQVIDWIGTVLALAGGHVTLAQVATAPFLPVLFVIVLAGELRRQKARRAEMASSVG